MFGTKEALCAISTYDAVVAKEADTVLEDEIAKEAEVELFANEAVPVRFPKKDAVTDCSSALDPLTMIFFQLGISYFNLSMFINSLHLSYE